MYKSFDQRKSLKRGMIALAAGAILATGLAHATASDEARHTVEVRYAKQELSTRQGVRDVYARLKSAARQVCPDIDARDLGRAAKARACYQEALSDAVSRISQPALNLVHARQAVRGAG